MTTFESGSAAKRESAKCLVSAAAASRFGLDCFSPPSLEGQWLLINYWATWCAPCRAEIGEFNHLAGQLKGQPVSVLGVNFDGLQGAELSKASAELGIDYRVLAQDPAQRWQLPRAEVLPVTYIVGPDGVLRERLLGEQTAAGLQARLALLQKGEH